jgi:hypothetical protein
MMNKIVMLLNFFEPVNDVEEDCKTGNACQHEIQE